MSDAKVHPKCPVHGGVQNLLAMMGKPGNTTEVADPIPAMDPVTTYAKDVVRGAVMACEWVKAACRRHLNDLEHGHERGLTWSVEAATRPIEFAHGLVIDRGPMAGRLLVLSPWQMFIVGSLFGWLKSDGTRRFQEAFIGTGRKNAVSTMLSAIGLYVLTDRDERRKQIFTLGATDAQAFLTYEHMVGTGKATPAISERVKFGQRRSVDWATGNALVPVSNGSRTPDGLNPHTIIADGLQAFRDGRGLEQLTYAMKSQRQPLTVMAEVADFNRGTFGEVEQIHAEGVVAGQIDADHYFAFIATLDKNDDPMDEAVWAKANPNLGASLPMERLREEAAQAMRDENHMRYFQVKHMNLWTVRKTNRKA